MSDTNRIKAAREKRLREFLLRQALKKERNKGIRPSRKPNKLSLLDTPMSDDEFKRQILGIYTHTDPDENAFLLSYSRWTSPLWSGPSVRMTRSYSPNTFYSLGNSPSKKRRKS